MQCWSKNPDEVHGPVVAIWEAQPSGNRVPLCKPCLDGWLDNADDEPDVEPARLQWVRYPTQRWCIQHNWPAELCRGWPHQPASCQARIWPSWAPSWQTCGSPLDTRGQCLRYGGLHNRPQWTEPVDGIWSPGFSQDPPPLDTRLPLFSLSPGVRGG